ncbi:hypothetical protein F5148DRAFT_1378216 [Russula earlei]|uniref:Uncharacterized protein n=1 Tax=Russula earlei TaxID=71964 RepID=A0ACC0TZY6_9AGAM|nr:hypothetical protein F5148DRAFT_1378216 [Russula earlei]
MSHGPDSLNSWEHLVGALESEHHHRICQIDLWPIPTSELEKLAAAMQKPYPELTSLLFWAKRYTVTPLSDSFLGGSAPLLRELWLHGCPFPGIPKLLLSSNQLVVLSLWNIPNSGYISPQDLVTALSVSSRLEILRLGFESPLHPRCRPPPPFTRSVLPALTRLDFKGVHAYLEVLVAQIEAPLLDRLCVTFFMDFDFVLPQLHRLISQTESFNSCDRATVCTSDSAIQFAISRETRQFPVLLLEIMQSDGQLSSLAQVCSSSFPLSTLVQLDIIGHCWLLHQTNNMVTTQWVEFLAPFTAVKDLRLSDQVEQHVCKALAELAEERRADVLPALRNIFLRHFLPWEIEGFVAARRLSGHPVAVHRWR